MIAIKGEAVNSVRGDKLLFTGGEIGSPDAVVGITVQVIDISVLNNGEEIVTTDYSGYHIATVGVHGVNIVIVDDTGKIDYSVVIAHRGNEFVRNLGKISLAAFHLVEGSVGLDLIIEIFAAQLYFAAKISDKTGEIASVYLAAIDTVLIGGGAKSCNL